MYQKHKSSVKYDIKCCESELFVWLTLNCIYFYYLFWLSVIVKPFQKVNQNWIIMINLR